mgnify:CR=1 FL=1
MPGTAVAMSGYLLVLLYQYFVSVVYVNSLDRFVGVRAVKAVIHIVVSGRGSLIYVPNR